MASTNVGIKIGLHDTGVIKGLNAIERSVSSLTGHISRMGHAVAGLVGVGELARMSDAFATLSARVSLASDGFGNAAVAQAKLFEIANASRVSIESLSGTYAALARAGVETGRSQSEMLRVTETLSKAMTIGGGSAQAQEAALTQLAQGLAAGTLRGEELNSVIEQAPRLARALADGLGVSIGALKSLGEQGQITSAAVFTALDRSASKIDEEFGKLPATIGQALTVLNNSLLQTIGVFDQANQVSSGLAQAIIGISQNMGVVLPTVGALAAGMVVLKTSSAAAAAATTGLSVAIGALGGPIGLVITALTGGVAAWMAWKVAASNSERSVQAQVSDSHEEIVSRIDAQIAKLKERNRLAGQELPATQNQSLTDAARLYSDANQRYVEAAQGVGQFAQLSSEVRAAMLQDLGRSLVSAHDRYVTLNSELLQSAQRETEKARESFMRDYRDGSAKMADALAAYDKQFKGKVSDAQYAQDTAAIRAKFVQATVATKSQYAELASAIQEKTAAQVLELETGEKVTEAQRVMLDIQKGLTNGTLKLTAAELERLYALIDSLDVAERKTALTKIEAQQRRDLQASINANIDASYKELGAIERGNEALEQEIETIGLGRAELAQLTAARLRDAAAMKEQQAIGSGDPTGTLARQAEALRRQAELVISKEAKLATVNSAQEAVDQWQESLKEVGQALAEEILRGGKNAGQLLKNYFKTLVLQPIIKAIVNPVAGAVAGSLGFSTAAQAGQGGLSALSNLAGLSSLTSAFGTSFSAGLTSTISSGFATTGLALEGGLAMVAEGTAASMAAGFGQIAGTLGPYAMAAMAVYALYKALDKSGTPHRGADVYSDGRTVGDPLPGVATGAFGTDAGFQNNRQPQMEAMLGPLALTAAKALNALSTLTGGTNQFAVALQFAADGVDESLGAIRVLANGTTLTAKEMLRFTNNVEQATKEFTGELALSMADAIKQTVTLPQMLADELDALRLQVGGPTIEALAAFTDRAVGLMSASKQMADALAVLPGSFAKVAGLTDELRIKLADLFGGFQAAGAAIDAYYQAFYSETERAAVITAQLTKSMAALGLSMPVSRDAFRALVDAQDLTTESGRNTYAALIKLSGAFAQVTPEIETAAVSLQSLAESVSTVSSRVLAASQKVDDIIRQREVERVTAINRRADEFAGLARSLRDVIAVRANGEQAAYQSVLQKAMAGDQQALRDLPEAARAAYEAERLRATSQAEADIAQQLILNDLAAAAAAAEEEAKKRAELPPAEDPLAVAMRELAAATAELGNTIPVKLLAGFDRIDTTLDGLVGEAEFLAAFSGAATESTLSAMFKALDKNGDGTVSRLEAIKANTLGLTDTIRTVASGGLADKAGIYNALRESGLQDADIRTLVEGIVGPQSSADWSLLQNLAEGYRLRREAELDVTAVIGLVEGSAALPASLRDALINGVSLLDVTVRAALDSNAPPAIKRLLVDQQGEYNSLISAALAAGLPADVLRVISDQGGSYTSLVSAVLASGIDPSAQALALSAGGELLRTVKAAIASGDPAAVALALQGSESITKTVLATLNLGSLTDEQRKFLSLASGDANRTVTLSGTVTFDPSNALQSVFNNISRTNEILIRGQQVFIEQLLGVTGTVAAALVTGAANSYTPNSAGYTGTYTLQASATGHLSTISTYFANLVSGTTSMFVRNNTWDTYLSQIRDNTANTSTHAFNAADTLIKIANRTFKPQVVYDRGTAVGGSVYAKGGVFTNSIVDSPTYFNESLMGEAGPEAIMPLLRGPGGDLGVRAFGAGARQPTDLTVLMQQLQDVQYLLTDIARHASESARLARKHDDAGRQRVVIDQDAGSALAVRVVT